MSLTPERLAALTRRARWDAGIAALLAENERLAQQLAECWQELRDIGEDGEYVGQQRSIHDLLRKHGQMKE